MAKRISNSEIIAQIPAARARAQRALESEPRARSAYCDQERELIIVALNNGAFFGFPAALAEGLAGSSAGQLAEVEVSPSGEGLHWESLDVDLLVSSLLGGVFGTKAWMKVLGQVGGRTRSEAKVTSHASASDASGSEADRKSTSKRPKDRAR